MTHATQPVATNKMISQDCRWPPYSLVSKPMDPSKEKAGLQGVRILPTTSKDLWMMMPPKKKKTTSWTRPKQ